MPVVRPFVAGIVAAAAAAIAPVGARGAPEPWRPDRAEVSLRLMAPAATPDDGTATVDVVPAAVKPRLPSLTDAILALPIVEEHRDDAGRLVRLARDPSGATVRYVIGADGRIADLEVWPASTK